MEFIGTHYVTMIAIKIVPTSAGREIKRKHHYHHHQSSITTCQQFGLKSKTLCKHPKTNC